MSLPLPSSRVIVFMRACQYFWGHRRRLQFALLASLCAHLVFLFPPHWNGWHEPQALPETMRLNVTLKEAQAAQPMLPPAAPVLPAPPEIPVPAPATIPAVPVDVPPLVEPVPPLEKPPLLEDLDTAVLVQEDRMAIPEDGVILPSRGVMRYTVYRGDQGFEVGRSELQWQIDDGSYYLNLHTETSGLAALLHPVTADAESRGHFSAEGLRPDRYRLAREDKESEDVTFIWEMGRIQIGARNPQPVHPGSQDILSLQFQFAYMLAPLDTVFGARFGARKALEFWIANDKRYELIRFEILGEEVLELPAGIFPTLHLQSVGGNKKIDFWLTNNDQMLPVKTRFTDKNGDIYEQALSEVHFEFDDVQLEPETDPPLHDLIPIPPQ